LEYCKVAKNPWEMGEGKKTRPTDKKRSSKKRKSQKLEKKLRGGISKERTRKTTIHGNDEETEQTAYHQTREESNLVFRRKSRVARKKEGRRKRPNKDVVGDYPVGGTEIMYTEAKSGGGLKTPPEKNITNYAEHQGWGGVRAKNRRLSVTNSSVGPPNGGETSQKKSLQFSRKSKNSLGWGKTGIGGDFGGPCRTEKNQQSPLFGSGRPGKEIRKRKGPRKKKKIRKERSEQITGEGLQRAAECVGPKLGKKSQKKRQGRRVTRKNGGPLETGGGGGAKRGETKGKDRGYRRGKGKAKEGKIQKLPVW